MQVKMRLTKSYTRTPKAARFFVHVASSILAQKTAQLWVPVNLALSEKKHETKSIIRLIGGALSQIRT